MRRRLTDQRAHVIAQIEALARHEQIVVRIGGHDAVSRSEEIAFQRSRLALVDALLTADEPAIRQRLADAKQTLGPSADVLLEQGDVRGLTPPLVMAFCRAELCLLALADLSGEDVAAEQAARAAEAEAADAGAPRDDDGPRVEAEAPAEGGE